MPRHIAASATSAGNRVLNALDNCIDHSRTSMARNHGLTRGNTPKIYHSYCNIPGGQTGPNKSISRQPSGCCSDKSGYRLSLESILLCVGVEGLAGDEEAVYEITGRVGRAHGLECSQVIHKILSFFCGERPKEIVPGPIQTEIPGFRALTRQILPVDDLQTTGNEMGFVVVPSFEIHIHSPGAWPDKPARLRRCTPRTLH